MRRVSRRRWPRARGTKRGVSFPRALGPRVINEGGGQAPPGERGGLRQDQHADGKGQYVEQQRCDRCRRIFHTSTPPRFRGKIPRLAEGRQAARCSVLGSQATAVMFTTPPP